VKLFADLIPGTDGARVLEAGAEILQRNADGAIGSDGHPWIVVTSPRDIAQAPVGASLWLRGYESAGPVGPHTALLLMRAVAGSGRPWIVSGLGPRAMAASLAIGAAGVVVDVPLWAIDESPLSPETRTALAACTSGRDTQVIEGVRVLTRTVQGHSGGPLPAPQSVGSHRLGDAPAQILDALRRDIHTHLQAIQTHNPLRRDPLRTGTPIVQGPMANISETTGLATAVSQAGALPFAALGALREDDARAVLARHAKLGRPWGVGVIGFDVMPHRDAHLEAIRQLDLNGPAAITLAGASPQLAKRLTDEGLPIWLHTPSARLAQRALSTGIAGVIFEGHEAGGHVGQLTSVGLWEEGLRAAETASRGLSVLAGGIGDATSAAFAAAMGAPAVKAGAEVVLQAGTAFLFTHEIRESGQITTAYQQAALACEETVLVGATVNLPLRCTPNAFAMEARAMENRWLEEGISRTVRRERLERWNLGRTRIAAKGLTRNPDFAAGGSRYVPVSRRSQDAEGAFSLGQGALLSNRLQSVSQLVRTLTTDALGTTHVERWPAVTTAKGIPSSLHACPRPQRHEDRSSTSGAAPIAIVGLGCVVPGAFDIPSYWTNLLHGIDSVGPIPEHRWRTERYFDSGAGTQGPIKTYAKIAATIEGFQFDPLSFRIPPRVLRTLDPSQRLALAASRQAVQDANWHARIDRRRAAVVLGNSMGGEYSKSLALRVRFREVLAAMDQDDALAHLAPEALAELHERVEARLAADLPPVDVDSMPGLLSNVVAGRVASWLDWMGGNMTVDAACAASLAAVSVAVDWLRSGRCDAVLTGGVDTDLAPETFVGFCRTGALSRTGSSPFSSRADGFVMGEGCAVLALKRLDDALRDNDPIWAVIRGVGQSSDGRGRSITAPRADGQRLAIERAYAEANFGPESVGMIEAHGTGTALGDATEVGVLREVFRDRTRPTWLGSVKSMIGHLKGGAGAAGLTKAVLSVATGTIPPTLHAGPLNPALGFDREPFRLPRRPVGFGDEPPRASVSAFGFGGTNYHVLIEAPPPEARRPAVLAALTQLADAIRQPDTVAAWGLHAQPPLVLAFGAPSHTDLLTQLDSDAPMSAPEVAESPYRLVLLTTPEQRSQDVARAAKWLRSDPKALTLADRIFRGVGPASPAVIVVPGQGAQKPGAWDSVASIPAGAKALAALPPPPAEADIRRPANTPLALHRSLYGVAVAWEAVLRAAQVPIAASVGHSLGELGALVVAGQLDPLSGAALAQARGEALEACPPGAMVAVEGDGEALASEYGLVLAAANAPGKVVLSGSEDAISRVPGRRLDVARAFHSPAVTPARQALQVPLQQTPFTGGIPCYSVSSGQPFKDPSVELAQAITDPVLFSKTVRALHSHTLFIELGPGRFLSRCIEATLPHARCIPLDPRPGDDASIPSAAAALLAAGHPGLLETLPGTMAHVGHGRATSPTQTPSSPPPTRQQPSQRPHSDVREAVITAICEVSGYPRDFLQETADLEGDLGIDSIRKMEILGLLEDRLGFTTREADYVALTDARIDTIVDHVEARLASPDDEAPAALHSTYFYAPLEVSISPASPESNSAPFLHDCPATETSIPVTVRQHIDWWLAARPPGPMVVIRRPEPASAASVGFARSLARERGTSARSITVYPGVDKARIAAEAASPQRPQDVVLRPSGSTAIQQVRLQPPIASLPREPVILATGGAFGIVARCLQALGDLSPKILLLGRRDAEALEWGTEVVYRRCDLTDPEAVKAAVDEVYERWNRLDILLHGAGTLRDRRVEDLMPEDSTAVLGPKIDGTEHLFAATRDRPPQLWVALSSIVARVGNPGQTLYGAANRVLETWQHPTAPRSVALPFTAWSDVGMASAPALQALLRSRGIRPLSVEAGTKAFRDLIGAPSLPPVVTITAQPLPEAHTLPWPLGDLRTIQADRLDVCIPLDPDDPALDHHRVGGRPLVPAALWVCALRHAVALMDHGPGPRSLESVLVHVPTFVERRRDDVFAAVQRRGDAWFGQIIANETIVAEARLGRGSLDRAVDVASPLVTPTSAKSLYTPEVLFHGPHWQVLAQVEDSGDGQSRADVIVPTGQEGLAAGVDAAHQLLALWSGRATGWLGLPVGARRWVVADHMTGPLRITSRARAAKTGIIANLVATDATGSLVFTGEGIHLKPATRWPEGLNE
jgi:acyl transferase domain-containing protein/NAD(P)H-dependent flavin oxidoreductase YrpB (nitropropane dioxygenase family)